MGFFNDGGWRNRELGAVLIVPKGSKKHLVMEYPLDYNHALFITRKLKEIIS
jgi:hypothetical protein